MTEAPVERTAAELAKSVLRSLHSAIFDVRTVRSLALDAAITWSQVTGASLPPLLQGVRAGPVVSFDTFESQRKWLIQASNEERVKYLPTLAYQLAAERGAGELLSSPSISSVAVIAALARQRPGEGEKTILDLTVGSGSMLVSLGLGISELEYRPRILAQDLQSDVATIAAASLFLSSAEADVRVANSLTTDAHPDDLADFVVSQPPFGLNWTHDEAEVRQLHENQGWYSYGLPSRSDATWLFSSRAIEKLRPAEAGGGRAVVFVAPRALYEARSSEIRRAVLNTDLLEAVIALPGGLSPSTGIPLYGLVFANNKPQTRVGKVQVIDLRPYFGTSEDRRSTARSLRLEAFEVLKSSFASIHDGPATRTVPTEYFIRRRVRVTSRPEAGAVRQRPLACPGMSNSQPAAMQRNFWPNGTARE